MKSDKTARGNASQFFVAGELCRRGYAAVVTLGNTPNTDVLCSNRQGTRFAHIQVKTFIPGQSRTCSVGQKGERTYGSGFFWVLAGIPLPGTSTDFEYFIVPAAEMARNIFDYHKRWLETPGKSGRPHRDSTVRTVTVMEGGPSYSWDVTPYRNRWDLIALQLEEPSAE